ncbi:unnamed protein product [Rhodiola kirilowii]
MEQRKLSELLKNPTTMANIRRWENEIYNIVPVHNLLADHPSVRFPEVRAVVAALKTVRDLRRPPDDYYWGEDCHDMMDWLRIFFRFQFDNVLNQREHLVMHLANAQMRMQPPPDDTHVLDVGVVKKFRRRLLKNYSQWCSYLGIKENIYPSDRSYNDRTRELLYVSLYLLVWGESANLRFMPECICYIFHHMAMELNKLLEDYMADPVLPPESDYGNTFMRNVVKPIYNTIRAEVESSKNGTVPHSGWRNYDDINEYFWSKRCFEELKWPIDARSDFFVTERRRRKTGFVEQRTFWNLFRSFDRLWIMLILFLQAAIIVAWEGTRYPWQALSERSVQVKVLTVFITWSGLRFLQAILDYGSQYSLVSRKTLSLGVRMLLKAIAAVAWIVAFGVLYRRILSQRDIAGGWDNAQVESRILNFLVGAFVFLAPEMLAVALFILPWIGNFIEKSNWKIFHMLSWWFQSRIFVGRGLREGLIDNIKYTLFWLLVLGTKFSFSYFLQIKPMVAPTKAILNLTGLKYEWHKFFINTNWFAAMILWIPVVLMYLMDMQIWYAIYSSFVGASVGLFQHIGEIRNMQQFKMRFQFFANAVQFNLMPEEEPQLNERWGTLRNKFNDAIGRLKLRYGLGTSYKKLESNQVQANKFALIWNEIITIFREEDIVSDHEVELLELPPNSWNVRVIRWPCLLLSNELLLALRQAGELVDANDGWMWYKISKHEYRRCAVIEAYDSVKHLLLEIIKDNTQEQNILKMLFKEIEHSIETEKFTKTFKTTVLPPIHKKLEALLLEINKPEKDIVKVVDVLQALYEIAIRDFFKVKRTTEQLQEVGLATRNSASATGLLFVNAVELPDRSNETFYRQIRRLHTILTSRDAMDTFPRNLEARRRIAFFSNSLFMNMPHAPTVKKMLPFSVLTPYYNEDVIYSKKQLSSENEDGISLLYYLQTNYEDEWKNFVERMSREGIVQDSELWTLKLIDLRLWASYRGQTLARTVRGMMYYYRALNLLAFLDSASDVEIQELCSMRRNNNSFDVANSSEGVNSHERLSGTSSSASLLFKGHEYGTVLMKYTYIVACQLYDDQRAKKDPRADDILYLMKANEALRVAYVREREIDRHIYYTASLVKYDQRLEMKVEIYNIGLPGPLKLGEGKPENQNHAFIFTRGDAVQTIDMNQDNYFEEALKMRNLLEEYGRKYGMRKPKILGVREHIFSGSVSSPARFMSAQETSFVTLGQRVLANPLKIRMHYGHPDVFDRFWFLTRGGISKASRMSNISEDIFAGFNCTLRGGSVTHHEYIQVGKGRDVGLNQISIFEAKVASGNGEQVLCRDVYRLGHRLDFFRMLSFYYTTVGFFFNTMMVVLTVYAFLWGRLYLALSGIEDAVTASSSSSNKALATILNEQFIIQLGLFTALPMIVENYLEYGFLGAIWDFIAIQLKLSSVFYTFSMGTRTHFFGRTILHGGAKYRATGRGFVVQHTSFAENYRLYARSHFVKAIELGLILVVYSVYSPVAKGTLVYIGLTISSWFLVMSWIMAPFLFNPSGFDWLKTVDDFNDFMNWIWFRDSVFAKAEQSWEKWWQEEQNHLRTTGVWGTLLEIILDFRFFFFQYAIVYQLHIAGGSTHIAVYFLSWVYILMVVGLFVACEKYAAKGHIYYRLVQLVVIVFVIIVIVALLTFTGFQFIDIFTSMLAVVPTGWGLLLIAQVIRPVLQDTMLWSIVVSVARLYDIMFGVIIMTPVALLSWMPGFHSMQTRLLFNEAFSRGLGTFFTGKKSTKDL